MATTRKRPILVLGICTVVWGVPFLVALGNAMSLGSADAPAVRTNAWALAEVLGVFFGFFLLMLILVALGVRVGQPIGVRVNPATGLPDVPPGQVLHSLLWVRLVAIGGGMTLAGFLGEGLLAVNPVSAGGLAATAFAYIPMGLIVCGVGFLVWGVWMRRRYPDRRSWRRGSATSSGGFR